MKYAVFTQAKNPLKHPAMPAECVYSVVHIEDSEVDLYSLAGFIIFTEEECQEYIDKMMPLYVEWLENYSPNAGNSRLKVLDLVASEFQYWMPNKIDFRRHLRDGINFEKKVVMLPNGRPDYAEYTYQGEVMARISFIFEVDQFNFMTKRTEILSYMRKNGSFGHPYAIWSQKYSRLEPSQQAERIKERVDARTQIFTAMKANIETFLAVYFMGQGMSYEQVLEIGGEFSMVYASLISAWKDTGTPALKNAILADTQFAWLDMPLPQTITGLEEAISIRNYIIQSLSY